MIAFAGCKINIGLRVLDKRPDGYHNIQSIFYPIPFYDVIEIVESEKTVLTIYGNEVEGDHNDNLIIKAYHLLKRHYKIPEVKINLLKNIPSGAGLGGGSSDGTSTLMLLNRMFDLKINSEQLELYALLLGSDCPFFVQNVPSIVESRGEVITPINFSLVGLNLLMVFPKEKVTTSNAYALLDSRMETPQNFSHSFIMNNWKNLNNDFEVFVFDQKNELRLIKNELNKNAALYTSMTGSGSVIYGLFDDAAIGNAIESCKSRKWSCKSLKLT